MKQSMPVRIIDGVLSLVAIVAIGLIVLGSLSGCTDGGMKQYTTIGSSGHIKCYSGALLIYEGDSTGKIATEHQSDGWYFEDAATHKLVRVSGACVIVN